MHSGHPAANCEMTKMMSRCSSAYRCLLAIVVLAMNLFGQRMPPIDKPILDAAEEVRRGNGAKAQEVFAVALKNAGDSKEQANIALQYANVLGSMSDRSELRAAEIQRAYGTAIDLGTPDQSVLASTNLAAF